MGRAIGHSPGEEASVNGRCDFGRESDAAEDCKEPYNDPGFNEDEEGKGGQEYAGQWQVSSGCAPEAE